MRGAETCDTTLLAVGAKTIRSCGRKYQDLESSTQFHIKLFDGLVRVAQCKVLISRCYYCDGYCEGEEYISPPVKLLKACLH